MGIGKKVEEAKSSGRFFSRNFQSLKKQIPILVPASASKEWSHTA